ncbi:lanC-like protein GCL2 isoform X2 [Abrus precatorius]|uniref:LanC-like protein GCL2 isoform X2 n=1 Tax=Abrus precatorius TaxID=3816 RepID=A0A8B8KUF1_ABRPR|nr:lanC-like protein GCL2 isoform X2 [Abrus precatorius]
MADRFFPNPMPEFVPETTPSTPQEQQEALTVGDGDSLSKLLAMPHVPLSERLKRAALDLKETIVIETWGVSGQNVRDFTLYCGLLGTASLLLKSYQVTCNTNDITLCSQIVKACDAASIRSRDVTFICGRAGVCAIGAVAAKYAGDNESLRYYLVQFEKAMVVDEVIKNGRALGRKGRCPLMFEWYGEKYWGAAHGLAGIMHVLLDMDLKPDELEDVRGTLKYMINNRFPSGNYPASEEDRKRDVLVHWCHGAPGMALTLVKAAKIFGDKEFLDAAIEAGEVVWNRGLLKRVGICHGISGNAYVFLSLYQLTGNEKYLYRAKAFACFLLDRAHKLISGGEMHGGDRPYSLFEGLGGMAYLFLDMIDPSQSKFPAYEL